MKKILIIIPTYNEKNNIINLTNEIKNVLNKTNLSYKILFVDDNSKDGTIEIINKIIIEDQNINLLKIVGKNLIIQKEEDSIRDIQEIEEFLFDVLLERTKTLIKF